MQDRENAGAEEHAPARRDVKSSRTLLVLGVMVLAALAPAAALAQDPAEVRAYLLSVKQLYGALEYESALAQIARARAIKHTPAEETLLSLYEGAILADMNRKEESAAAFKKGLLLQPDAQLPVKVAPSVSKQFETIRETVKQELAALQKPPPPVAPPPPVIQEPQPVVTEASSAPSRSFTRPQVLVPAVGGAVLMTLGGTSWVMARKQLSSLTNDTPLDGDEAHRIASRGKTFQAVGVGLLGAGVAGLGIAVGWYAFGSSPEQTALSVGTDGTSAFVQGRWP